MFSPKELEGEVDHSFFDSDGETGKTVHQDLEENKDNHVKRPGQPETERKIEEGRRVENEEMEKEEAVEQLEEHFSSLQLQMSGAPSTWTNEGKEEDSENAAVKERREPESGGEDSTKKPSLESRHDSQSDSSSVRSYSSVEPHSDSSDEDGDDDAVFRDDDDGYSETESENNDGEKLHEPPSSKQTSRKSAGKFRSRSRSSSSDGDSSFSGDRRSPAPSPKLSVAQATLSPRRRPRLGSANQRERAKASESEDTVTDVTPLSTPDVSPEQSFDLTPPTEPSETVARQQQEEPSVTEVDAGKRRSSDTDGEERSVVLSAGRRVDSVLVISSPSSASSRSCSSRHPRNYSFTNDEVRRIERENQRLLRELSRPSRSSPRSRSGGSALSTAARRSAPPTARLYHSALNRQREQQRIQRENLAFLKRLESVKPTPGMTRAEQLADYQRQAGYLGIPTPLIRPSSGRGSRPCSTNSPHRTRPETAKPSRTTAPRPAWS